MYLSQPIINQHCLILDLRTYEPFDEHDRIMAETTGWFIQAHSNFWDRSLRYGHVTASAWIMDYRRQYVLLTHHAKLDKWLQLGGHIEHDPDVIKAAIREAHEESGLERLSLVSRNIFDIDVHIIPANDKEQEHFHYDIRFLFQADKNELLRVSKESKKLAWININELPNLTRNPSMLRMLKKAISAHPIMLNEQR